MSAFGIWKQNQTVSKYKHEKERLQNYIDIQDIALLKLNRAVFKLETELNDNNILIGIISAENDSLRASISKEPSKPFDWLPEENISYFDFMFNGSFESTILADTVKTDYSRIVQANSAKIELKYSRELITGLEKEITAHIQGFDICTNILILKDSMLLNRSNVISAQDTMIVECEKALRRKNRWVWVERIGWALVVVLAATR